jgi:glycosyltransferase involved in cell wall biosynthesis
MPDRIKVLFVIPSLACGGAERVMLLLLRYLNRERYDPLLLTLGEENDFPGELAPDVRAVCLRKRSRWTFVQLCRGVARTLRQERPQLLVSFLTYANWISVIAAGWSRIGVRVILSERSPLRQNLKSHGYYPLRVLLTRQLHPRADGLIAVSRGVRDELVSHFGVAAEKCFALPNPVEIERIGTLANEPIEPPLFADDWPIVVSCGRLVPVKNLPLLLRAIADIRERRPAHLVILGDGPERLRLEKLAGHLRVSEQVRFLGFQRNPFKYMAASTVLVLSSDCEGFGLVIPEAMACGTPVIASDCPFGPSEILTDGRDGFLFPSGDPQALAELLVKLLGDAALRQRLALAARQTVQRYEAKRVVQEYESVFERVLK